MIDDFKLQTQQTNELSTEVQELQKEAREHLANSKSKNTKRAYGTDWNQFESWCQAHALESLPTEPQTLVSYITFLGRTKKAATIKRKMTAISQRHETAGFKSPTKTALVKGVWEGIQRRIGIKEEGKEALWLHELRRVIEVLPQNKLIGVRNRAILVIGWSAALRRSELVSLNIEDISKTRDGLILQLNKSKTDQKGEGHMIALPFGSNPTTCPVRSFEDWIAAADITEGALFRRVDRHGNVMGRLTDQSVRLVVKKCCEDVGLDAKRYGAHSLRSGFCSTAAKAGKAEHQIMKQTRHKRSDSLQRYIKKANLFDDNAASGIGL
ncbi:site-specific integrase [Salinibacillus xinjiangensis]|uniref:Tyrosine-type recombinase/integrase n=1 Tax=Salinibacillus xinjiangensis TaxID=1229268 RepID=A0A6G1X7C5_9BACI|nr:site-specific integrase [Salinibacillus xinjiangensis]MRG86708.1 tyrosine-type recombinase/integrase [Salinibacillus xinjiangensis]